MNLIATDKKKTNLIQTGNSKLKEAGILMFNLPAGKITCGRVCVGCYALKEEARWPSVITARTTRLEASKQLSFVDDIQQELNKKGSCLGISGCTLVVISTVKSTLISGNKSLKIILP